MIERDGMRAKKEESREVKGEGENVLGMKDANLTESR